MFDVLFCSVCLPFQDSVYSASPMSTVFGAVPVDRPEGHRFSTPCPSVTFVMC